MKNVVLFTLIALLTGCGKSTEVTIVKSGSGLLPEEQQTQTVDNTAEPADSFSQVAIGESDAIDTLDPLFASSNSELRLIHLLYDGLTRLNDQGIIVPALASRWDISPDSLRYTFHLRKNTYFHNSNAFSNGLGRRVSVNDIRNSFQRMTSILVPDNAASLFDNIHGFSAYHQEQSYVKNPAKRVLTKIEGIVIQNDSTISFNLIRKEPAFLSKLAHPLASIYPQESLTADGKPIQKPIGTGPFYFVQLKTNNIILASYDDYYRDIATPDRIDLISGLSEAKLFQSFAKNNLQALLEIGPETKISMLKNDGQLTMAYAPTYRIESLPINSRITFYYNPLSNQPEVPKLLATLSDSLRPAYSYLGNLAFYSSATGPLSAWKGSIQVAHTNNHNELYLLNKMAMTIVPMGATLSLNASYAVTENITLSSSPFPGGQAALSWDIPIYNLYQNGTSSIQIRYYPWNISFDGVTTKEGDNK